MAKLVRSVCVHCGRPTAYCPKVRAHRHLRGIVHRDGTSKGCSTEYPEIRMETLIENY